MGARNAKTEDGGEFVTGLANGLAALKAFEGAEAPLSQSEVSAAAGLTRATARRSLLTLIQLGYVEKTALGYRTTPRVMELASTWLNDPAGWVEIARPWLTALRDKVGENVSSVVLDRSDVVYAVTCPANRVISLNTRIGDRKPAFATAMGRVLLAQMPQDCLMDFLERYPRPQFTPKTVTDEADFLAEIEAIRSSGFATIEEELEPGLWALALPIHNRRGQCLAALNICGHSSQSSLHDLQSRHLDDALETAEKLKDAIP